MSDTQEPLLSSFTAKSRDEDKKLSQLCVKKIFINSFEFLYVSNQIFQDFLVINDENDISLPGRFASKIRYLNFF